MFNICITLVYQSIVSSVLHLWYPLEYAVLKIIIRCTAQLSETSCFRSLGVRTIGGASNGISEFLNSSINIEGSKTFHYFSGYYSSQTINQILGGWRKSSLFIIHRLESKTMAASPLCLIEITFISRFLLRMLLQSSARSTAEKTDFNFNIVSHSSS